MSASEDRVDASTPTSAPKVRDWVVNAAPTRRWPPLRIGQLWTHRELIYFFALRDLKVRYKQAFLGVAWAGIQPLIGALTFTILFNRLADVDVDAPSYFAFALLGFGVWTYFSSTLQAGTASLLYNAELLTKVAFPRIVAPTATFLPGLIDLAVGAVLASSSPSLAERWTAVRGGLLVGLPLGLVLLVLAVAGPVLLPQRGGREVPRRGDARRLRRAAPAVRQPGRLPAGPRARGLADRCCTSTRSPAPSACCAGRSSARPRRPRASCCCPASWPRSSCSSACSTSGAASASSRTSSDERAVIELEGVGKRYRLGEHHGNGTDLRETLAGSPRRLRGTPPARRPRDLVAARRLVQRRRGHARSGSSAPTAPARARC